MRVLEAYSPDWTGFLPQPDPDGDVLATYGPLSFINIRPVSGTSAGGGGSSSGVSARRLDRHPRGGRHRGRGCAHDRRRGARRTRTRRSHRVRRKGRTRVSTRRYLLSKIFQAVLTLLFVLVFNFFLFRGLGDPTQLLAKQRGQPDPVRAGGPAFAARPGPAAAAAVRELPEADRPRQPRTDVRQPARVYGDRQRDLADGAAHRNVDDRLDLAGDLDRHPAGVALGVTVRSRVRWA